MPIVYMATNEVNGKRYIGVTKGELLVRRRQHEAQANYKASRSSGMPIVRAIRKYGPEVFTWALLARYLSFQAALDAEVQFIADMKPEYNRTHGGGGIPGLVHTPEAKAKMSKAKMGKPNLELRGRKHSLERVEKNRLAGLKQKDKWLERSWQGPAARSRTIKCLDDGQIYKSLSAAARAYGISTGALSEHCTGARNRATVGGHRFAYVDGTSPENRTDSRRKFTPEQVRAIRVMAAEGISLYRIAKNHKVAWVTIRDMVEERMYKHVSA